MICSVYSRALDDALERVEILIALRKAPEASLPSGKYDDD